MTRGALPLGASRASRCAYCPYWNPAGTALIYSTYLGGRGDDGGNGIVADASGNVTVVGRTASTASRWAPASPFKITATVPAGATTGKIGVTTPAGTATSAGTFTIP